MEKLWINNEMVDRIALLQKTEQGHPGINQVAIEKRLVGNRSIEGAISNQLSRVINIQRRNFSIKRI